MLVSLCTSSLIRRGRMCYSQWLRLLLSFRYHTSALAPCFHRLSLFLSYLLPKNLSPVKDLEQPVSFSSSTQTGGDNEDKDGGTVEEEGSEE